MNQPNGIIVDPEVAAQRANVLLESEIQSRISAVRVLAQRQNAVDAAIAEYETAWQAASRAGWSEEKLRDIGLRSPETSPAPVGRRSAVSAEQSPMPTIAPVVHLAPPMMATPASLAAPPTLVAPFPETVDSAR